MYPFSEFIYDKQDLTCHVLSYLDVQSVVQCRQVSHPLKQIFNDLFNVGNRNCLFKKEICESRIFTHSIFEIMPYFFKNEPDEKKFIWEENGYRTSFVTFLRKEVSARSENEKEKEEEEVNGNDQLFAGYLQTDAFRGKCQAVKNALHEMRDNRFAHEILNEIVQIELKNKEYLRAYKLAKIMHRLDYPLHQNIISELKKINFPFSYFPYAAACFAQNQAVNKYFPALNIHCPNNLTLRVAKLLAEVFEENKIAQLNHEVQEKFVKSSHNHPRGLKFAAWITSLVKNGEPETETLFIQIMGKLAEQKEYKLLFLMFLAISKSKGSRSLAYEGKPPRKIQRVEPEKTKFLRAMGDHLDTLQLDCDPLKKSLMNIIDYLDGHPQRNLAIRHLKNFIDCLPRNIDQIHLQQFCSTENIFPFITAISLVFDAVHIRHLPNLESFYIIGISAIELQNKKITLSKEKQQAILKDLTSPYFNALPLPEGQERPQMMWIRDLPTSFISSLFAALLEKKIYWPIFDFDKALGHDFNPESLVCGPEFIRCQLPSFPEALDPAVVINQNKKANDTFHRCTSDFTKIKKCYHDLDIRVFKTEAAVNYFVQFIELINLEEYKDIRPNSVILTEYIRNSGKIFHLNWFATFYTKEKLYNPAFVDLANRFFGALIIKFLGKRRYAEAKLTFHTLSKLRQEPVDEKGKVVEHPLFKYDEKDCEKYRLLHLKMLSGFYDNIDVKKFNNEEIYHYYLEFIDIIDQDKYAAIKPDIISLEYFIQLSKDNLNLDWIEELYLKYSYHEGGLLITLANDFFGALIRNFMGNKQDSWAQKTALALFAFGQVPVKDDGEYFDLEIVTWVMTQTLGIHWKELQSDENVNKLLPSICKLPDLVFKHAVGVLNDFVLSLNEAESICNDSNPSYQLIKLLTEFGIPCEDDLQNTLLYEELCFEAQQDDWLQICEELFKISEISHDHLKLTFKLIQYFSNEQNYSFSFDSELEERMIKVIELFSLADQRGLVSIPIGHQSRNNWSKRNLRWRIYFLCLPFPGQHYLRINCSGNILILIQTSKEKK